MGVGMEEPQSGYREVDHTADWTLEVWAGDMAGLLEQAARGMYAMADLEVDETQKLSRRFELEPEDRETLVVQFLSDLLYRLQIEHLAFDRFHLDVDDGHCNVFVVGHPVRAIQKEIKAVTWHGLSVREDGDQLRAQVTFDV
jgi:SHS2 domain-containing protein